MEVVRLQTLWSSLSLEYSGDRNERLEFHGRDRRNSFSSKELKKKEMSRIVGSMIRKEAWVENLSSSNEIDKTNPPFEDYH